ncbi:MAG: MBL fold metallo-hydrolase [Gemmatimonadaceae bacterium]|nr:MBL fold metallo-hydrolase [Gemmatimonadaceae bacterium]
MHRPVSRRTFLIDGASCTAHLALAAAVAPHALRRLWAQEARGPVVTTEPFGRLEQVADGIWALISTPLTGARDTVANGGIIAGRSGVLAIEGFMTPGGAAWLARQAKQLTGRWPTHLVVTHYHADHSSGVAGYRDDANARAMPRTLVTEESLTSLFRAMPTPPAAPDEERKAALTGALRLAESSTTVDLGGRTVRLVRRDGHTASDVSVEVDDPSVVFTGDLVWNAMFPNFVDATPTRLALAARALRRERQTTYVPGHGGVATDADVGRYLAMLGEVEQAARAAHGKGTPVAEAAAAFTLSPALGEWALFNKVFFERAFAAWYRELGVGDDAKR